MRCLPVALEWRLGDEAGRAVLGKGAVEQGAGSRPSGSRVQRALQGLGVAVGRAASSR